MPCHSIVQSKAQFPRVCSFNFREQSTAGRRTRAALTAGKALGAKLARVRTSRHNGRVIKVTDRSALRCSTGSPFNISRTDVRVGIFRLSTMPSSSHRRSWRCYCRGEGQPVKKGPLTTSLRVQPRCVPPSASAFVEVRARTCCCSCVDARRNELFTVVARDIW